MNSGGKIFLQQYQGWPWAMPVPAEYQRATDDLYKLL